ncbi:MAG: F0F1 ATP synthase subunit B' [Paracoccaceae bacterium]
MSMASLFVMAAAAAGDGAEQAKGGLPQLNVETFPSQIFWLVVTMVGLFYLMSKIALPRIASVLEERADAIADELDQAEEYKRRAQEAEETYEKALSDARARATEIAAQKRAEIEAQVDAAMAEADAEIAARTAEGEKRIAEIQASAAEAVTSVAQDTAVAVVEAIMPDAADASALQAAVQTRLGS